MKRNLYQHFNHIQVFQEGLLIHIDHAFHTSKKTCNILERKTKFSEKSFSFFFLPNVYFNHSCLLLIILWHQSHHHLLRRFLFQFILCKVKAGLHLLQLPTGFNIICHLSPSSQTSVNHFPKSMISLISLIYISSSQ